MDREKAQKVLSALDRGEISENDARSLLQGLQGGGEETVSDEGHEDFPWSARFAYKNFGGDAEQGLNYLRKEYPEFEYDIKDQSIVLKKPGEKVWKRLDPEGFDAADITDVLFDAGAAVGETAATAAGGLVGAIGGTALGPAGTVAGGLGLASAAGGTAGAGIEGLRQSIGKMLGTVDEYDTDSIKMSGAFGAASPFMFGTGAGAKQVAKYGGKYLKDAAQQAAVEQAQRSAITRGAGAVAPTIFSATTNIPTGVLRHTKNNIDELDKVAKEATGDAIDYAPTEVTETFLQQATTKIDNMMSEAGEEYKGYLKQMGKTDFDVVDAYQPMIDIGKKYEQRAARDMKPLISRHLEDTEAFASFDIDADEVLKVIGDPMPTGKKLKDAIKGVVAEQMDQRGYHAADINQLVNGGEMNAALRDLMTDLGEKGSYQNYNIVRRAIESNRPSSRIVNVDEVLERQSTLNDLNLIRTGKDTADIPNAVKKDLIASARESAKRMGGTLDKVEGAGPGFKQAKNKFTKTFKAKDQFKKTFGDYKAAPEQALEKTEKQLKRLISGRERMFKKNVKKLGKTLNLKPQEFAEEQMAKYYMLDPSLMPASDSIGTTLRAVGPGAALGGVLGYGASSQLGGGHGGGVAGATIGSGIGALMAGPAAFKAYMRMANQGAKMSNASQRLGPASLPTPGVTGMNVWSNMSQNER